MCFLTEIDIDRVFFIVVRGHYTSDVKKGQIANHFSSLLSSSKVSGLGGHPSMYWCFMDSSARQSVFKKKTKVLHSNQLVYLYQTCIYSGNDQSSIILLLNRIGT
jgi:hypothetical protein